MKFQSIKKAFRNNLVGGTCMSFNLLEERWIPVICRDGLPRNIAPWELTTSPEPVSLDIPRPDFQGAMMEFLIGLVQTAMPPKNTVEWEKRITSPPEPQILQAAFAPLMPLFNLFSKGLRFLQDRTLTAQEVKETSSISDLLIEFPTGKTLRDNGDFFVKRGQVETMCPACAARALITLQTYAPAGGVGNRTSLRGGGPLTTLIKGDTLWQTVALNIRPLNAVESSPLPEKETWGKVFPWAIATVTSEKKGSELHPSGANRLQAHWGMPRRIVLLPETLKDECPCDLCGASCRTVVREYISKNYGINYGDSWRHPLSPYRSQGAGKPTLAIKGLSNGAGYEHWLGIIYGMEENGKGITPARNISHFNREFEESESGTVLAYGYAMDNMKPLMWCEGEYPVYPLADATMIDEFRLQVQMCVAAADKTRKTIISCLKKALFADEGRNAKASQSLFEEISRLFWIGTEKSFYETARTIALNIEDENALTDYRQTWGKTLQHQAENLFDQTADRGAGEHNIRTMIRVQQVRAELIPFVISGNRKILELPTSQKRRIAL